MIVDELKSIKIDEYYPEAYQQQQIDLGGIVVNELNNNDVYTINETAGVRKLMRNLFGVCIEYGWGEPGSEAKWSIETQADAYNEYYRRYIREQ